MAQLIMNKARKAQVADNDAPLSGRGAPDNSSLVETVNSLSVVPYLRYRIYS